MMKKLMSIIAFWFTLISMYVQAATYIHSERIRFYVIEERKKVKVEGERHDFMKFHVAMFNAAIDQADMYFKNLDPDFDIKDYDITIFITRGLYRKSIGVYDWKYIFVHPVDMKDRKSGRPYQFCGQDMTQEIYVAILMHEISHAVLHQRNGRTYTDYAAHEYFAYNVMFDIMQGQVYQEALEFHHIIPLFKDSKWITKNVHDMSPERFALMARRHRLWDGGKIFNKIWNGKFISIRSPRHGG